MLINPRAPPLPAMTCGARRAGRRQGLSLCCCWGSQQVRPKSWVLLTCSFSHALRIPLMFANMSCSVLPHIIQYFMIFGPSRPVVCFIAWGGGGPECTWACIKERFSPPLCFRASLKFASQVQVRVQGEYGGEHGLGPHFNCSPDVSSKFQQQALLLDNMGRDGLSP